MLASYLVALFAVDDDDDGGRQKAGQKIDEEGPLWRRAAGKRETVLQERRGEEWRGETRGEEGASYE